MQHDHSSDHRHRTPHTDRSMPPEVEQMYIDEDAVESLVDAIEYEAEAYCWDDGPPVTTVALEHVDDDETVWVARVESSSGVLIATGRGPSERDACERLLEAVETGRLG